MSRVCGCLGLWMLAAACGGTQSSGVVITRVLIADGSGAEPVAGSVRFVGDSIVAVGTVEPVGGDSIVDGGGLILAPGFIDTHSHHDGGLLEAPAAVAAVSQGITTIIAGQDGGHPLPLAPVLDALEANPPAVNVGYYAGHGTIRRAVMGTDFRRSATAAEVDSMSTLLRRELAAGAFGLSTGLEYDPGIYSSRGEVLALARVAAAAGGRYISHIRSEDRWFWEALDEIVAVGREAQLPVQVSHMKLAMTGLWGRVDSAVAVLERARASGVDITADVYPYPYWQSTLTVLFPNRDFDNRTEALKILEEIAPADGLLLGDFRPEPALAGKTVAEISRLRGTDDAATLMALIRESLAWELRYPDSGSAESVVATSMTEADVDALLAWPHANVSSDGALAGAHPRGYGAFPRVLGRVVRERGVMTLGTAVRKMTSLSAEHVGISRRGRLAPGYHADMVLFDPVRVQDQATPTDPHRTAVGIEQVWVNGQLVWHGGAATGRLPGRVVRRESR